MPIAHITKTEVDQLEHRPDYRPRHQTLYYDLHLRGFGVCVGPLPKNPDRRPTKTYFAEGQPNGKTRRKSIGRHGIITAEQARREAKAILGRMANDQDPVLLARAQAEAQRQQTEADRSRLVTLSQAAALFLQSRRLAATTLAGFQWSLDRHFPDWLDRPLAEITRRDAFEKHKLLTTKHGPYGANGAMRQFRAIYNLALKHYEHLPPTNPCITVAWNEETPRDSAIPVEKLADWYKGVCALPNPLRRDYYEFVMFSGLRRESAATMRWEHVDLEAGTLFIPEPKGGKKRAFTLPLSDHLVAVLKRRREQNKIIFPKSPWVWPSDSAKGRITEPKLSPQDRKRVAVPFGIHDLRHSYATYANAAGISGYDLKMLLNHAMPKGDVTGGYLSAGEHLRRSQQRVTDYILSWMLPGTKGEEKAV